MRSDQDRLQDIIEAIRRVVPYVSAGRDEFDRSEPVRYLIIHHLVIVGEAANRVSESTRLLKPAIPWPQISAMRNLIVHEYFGIDLDEIWNAAIRDLPLLLESILPLLETIRQRDGR